MRIRSLLPWSLFLVAAPLGAQSVIVVDAANRPGADFVDLSSAVAASVEGDVILMREGDYGFEDLVLNGRGLLLQGEAGAEVTISKISVTNLPAGSLFAARNLNLEGGGVSSQPAINVLDCAGIVWFEDIYVSGVPNAFHAGGVLVQDSTQAVFTRVEVDAPFNLALGHSFEIQDSEVHLFDCSVEGLAGGGSPFFSDPGELALRMTDGELYLNGSSIIGGMGAIGVGTTGDGAMGGPALELNGQNPIVHILDSVLLGGPGGAPSAGGNAGPMGLDIVQNAPGAILDFELGSMRKFEVSSPVRENSTLFVSIAGLLGDRVLLSRPGMPGPARPSPRWNGAGVTPLLPLMSLGSLTASGPLNLTFNLGELPPGREFSVAFTQAHFRDTRFTVGTPSFVLLLDESF